MLGNKKLGWAVAIGLGLVVPSLASAQEACTTYTVKDGDTLGSIAQSAYGTFDYQLIFNANREILASGANVLSAGTQLVLPCEDGRLTADAEVGTIIQQEADKAAAAPKKDGAYRPAVRVLTANGWAAFTDESLPGGGMFVRLVTTALERAGNDMAYKVSYVDDVVSHIDTLLPSGAFDVGIAWDIEDCTNADLLPDLARKLCLEFNFSDPIYEIVYGYATLADSKYAEARSYDDFAGARMCRPVGWASSDLIRNGLVEPLVTWVRPEAFNECYEKLQSGEVDVYAMDVEFIAGNLKEDPEGGKNVVVNSYLAEFMPQGFVVLKSNPRGRDYLNAVNAGLREMRESGEWYDVVASSLAAYNNIAQ